MLDNVGIQELSIQPVYDPNAKKGYNEFNASRIFTDLEWSSLQRQKWQAMQLVASPASRLDGGQFPLVSPIPCHRSQHSRHMFLSVHHSAGPAGLQSQTSQTQLQHLLIPKDHGQHMSEGQTAKQMCWKTHQQQQ